MPREADADTPLSRAAAATLEENLNDDAYEENKSEGGTCTAIMIVWASYFATASANFGKQCPLVAREADGRCPRLSPTVSLPPTHCPRLLLQASSTTTIRSVLRTLGSIPAGEQRRIWTR